MAVVTKGTAGLASNELTLFGTGACVGDMITVPLGLMVIKETHWSEMAFTLGWYRSEKRSSESPA